MSCFCEGTLVRFETSNDGLAVAAVVVTVKKLWAEQPGGPGKVPLDLPSGEVRLPTADLQGLRLKRYGVCGAVPGYPVCI